MSQHATLPGPKLASSPQGARPAVVVALDGSPAAATALPLGQVVARQLNAPVEILHVAPSPHPDPEMDRLKLLSCGLKVGSAVQVRWVVGEPVAGILGAISDPAVELVVLTTHGRAIQPDGYLGRVAEGVIAHTRHPVLLVRPETAARAGPAPAPLRCLLLPLDGTPKTATALQPATDLAGRLGASIDVLYVASAEQVPSVEPGTIRAPRYVDQPHHEWLSWANEVAERLCTCLARSPASVPVRVHLAWGSIGAEIARFATGHHVDATVLVRRSRLQAGHARVLRAVLTDTPCPILLVAGTP
jgi:nucleotide-binding universal stress UspA family protein